MKGRAAFVKDLRRWRPALLHFVGVEWGTAGFCKLGVGQFAQPADDRLSQLASRYAFSVGITG
ncbi:hypothetical protein [Achromobacter animicus]|uniref:hypothetical protein n=1 Tax=Achromobacter animicus TaxID=1389935 RepID=UPI0028A92B28|nr:hypothetical protein [Achromobacter animicus]